MSSRAEDEFVRETNEDSQSQRSKSSSTKQLSAVQARDRSLLLKILLYLYSSGYRTSVVQQSILRAFQRRGIEDRNIPPWEPPSTRGHFNISTFFTLYDIHLRRCAPALFQHLRRDNFHIPDSEYHAQFEQSLLPLTGMGLSGSRFFFTKDRSYLVKSLGRHFEYSFLYEEFLSAYHKHLDAHPSGTLFCQITDVLCNFDLYLGQLLGTAPSHYLVMTNLLTGMDKDAGWQKWDLKPQNFFEPTRDVIPDSLKTEQMKTGLADSFDDEKILLKPKQRDDFMNLARTDTLLLSRLEVIDYSLLLGRYPLSSPPSESNPKPPRPESWQTGVTSSDGKYVYRACIVDFFWNVHRLQPRVMRAAGIVMPEQTITTEPERYRTEFLKMLEDYVEMPDDDAAGPSGEA